MSARLPLLFVLSVLGVLAIAVVGVGEVLGWPVAAGVAAVLLVALGAGAWRHRPKPQPRGHAHECDCCGDQPWTGVKVV
jgi:hypothetical protein